MTQEVGRLGVNYVRGVRWENNVGERWEIVVKNVADEFLRVQNVRKVNLNLCYLFMPISQKRCMM